MLGVRSVRGKPIVWLITFCNVSSGKRTTYQGEKERFLVLVLPATNECPALLVTTEKVRDRIGSLHVQPVF